MMYIFCVGFIAAHFSIVVATPSVVDKYMYHYSSTNFTSLTGEPAILETKDKLPDGMVYAKPFASQLFRKLTPENPAKVTESGIAIPEFESELFRAYLDQQLLTYFPDRKHQEKYTFSFDIFKKLGLNDNNGSELSHAGIPQRGKQERILEPTAVQKTDHLIDRAIIPPDDREEICNSWAYPYRTIGRLELDDDEFCTGTSI